MSILEVSPEEALSLLRAVPGSYLILLPDAPRFTITGVTNAYLEATYTRRETLIGLGLFDAFPDNPNNPFATGVRNLRHSLEQVLATGEPHRMADQQYDVFNPATGQYEFRIWRPLNKPVRDEQGGIRYIFHWVEDVTEHSLLKASEAANLRAIEESNAALQQSNDRFQLLNRATQDAVWDWDLRSNNIWWNESFHSLFGYLPEQIEPTVESWYSRLHPDDRERIINSIQQTIESGGANWSDEYRFRKADGSYATVYDRGYALHGPDGRPYRMIGSMIDITNFRRVVNTAIENETRTRLAIETARLGTYEVDLTSSTIVHSPRAAEIFGLDVTRTWPYEAFVSAIHPEDVAHRQRAHERSRENGSLFYEARIIKPDGQQSWIRLNGKRTRLENRDVLIGTMLDITEERKAADLLEQKIQERTHELTQANEQLKQFTYAASHDLQEPLRKINFFVDRLVNTRDNSSHEEQQHLATRILHTTNRMRVLIDDLLNYSNTTQGTMQPVPVALTEVVQEVLDDMEAAIIQKNALIEVGDLPVIRGDRRQLKQMFQNLVSNALKYHSSGQVPQVSITAGPALQQTGMLEIQVCDRGIGFAPEDAGRIFGLFQRLHGRSEYEGTGIGLAIVQKVVENHQGTITAESTAGAGATFRILLPLQQP